ncbi:fimbrial protein [Hafnia alvei]|uniref:fimbrial protein n=1 Tax=Hafnia alvei TaxID=569 RepID=UPI0014131E5F|nr:type 1 fimbrial protein [Hafnia alvei]QIP58246.1 type 1 fimbrial protein [Hafnia alvei]
MKKTISAIFVSSVLAASAMTVAHAAPNTTVNVMGTVNATTCDVVANTQSINLGNAKPTDFTAVNTVVDSTKQTFAIQLQNCGTSTSAGQAQLKVTGPVTSAGSSYFSKDPASVVAVSLTTKDETVTNGELINVGGVGDDANKLNATQVPFEVALKSSQANPSGGVAVEAPITFSFVYN